MIEPEYGVCLGRPIYLLRRPMYVQHIYVYSARVEHGMARRRKVARQAQRNVRVVNRQGGEVIPHELKNGRYLLPKNLGEIWDCCTNVLHYQITLTVGIMCALTRISTMSNITDAQQVAVYNAEGQALPASVAQASGNNIVETVVSGTPFQVSTLRAALLYIAITTSAAVTVSMGPEAAGTSIAIAPSESEALGVTTLEVPAGWWVKLTGTVADFTVTAVLR